MGREDEAAAAPRGDKRLRILLLLSSLHGGGAERVAVHLLNRLDRSRFDVRMGLLRAAGPWLDHVDPARRGDIIVAPNGDRHFVFEGANAGFYRPDRLIGGALRAPRALRAMIADSRPDIVMSFLKGTSVLTWRALAGMRDRPGWIVREGNNTLAVIAEETKNRVVRAGAIAFTRRAYARADRVLVNSRDMATGVAEVFGLDPARMPVINNPIDIAAVEQLAASPLADPPVRPFLLNVGRLEHQKAHDVLIRAYAACAVRETHDLVILGRGSLEESLRRLAASLGVGTAVRFAGFCDNPYAWMARADLFVLPSRWEGFPTVAAEALACRVPVLISDCRFGPRDVLEHGDSGWIVPVGDEAVLSDSIDMLIADPALRERLARGGRARVERFKLETVIERYAALFAEPGLARGP